LALAPDQWDHFATLALTEAMQDDGPAAIRDAEHAIKLAGSDGLHETQAETVLARVHALLGNAESAVAALRKLLTTPGSGVTKGLLQLDPVWDRVRADSRFVAITEGEREMEAKRP
jgi:hypothetical protein